MQLAGEDEAFVSPFRSELVKRQHEALVLRLDLYRGSA